MSDAESIEALREALSARGLSLEGDFAELEERLVDAIANEEIDDAACAPDVGAMSVNLIYTTFTSWSPDYWPFVLGGMALLVVLFFPSGMMGIWEWVTRAGRTVTASEVQDVPDSMAYLDSPQDAGSEDQGAAS